MQLNSTELTKILVEVEKSLNVQDKNIFTNISTDTRKVTQGSLFIALKGEKFDGHNFLEQAKLNGALGAIVSKINPGCQLAQWQLADPLTAYGKLAAWWQSKFNVTTFAITGSVGKTTTKNMLANILSSHQATLATQANFNNEVGLPQTILQLNSNHKYLVLEMGAGSPGDIEYLCQFAKVNYSAITKIAPCHIEKYKDEADIAHTKSAIFAQKSLKVGVCSADSKYLKLFEKQCFGCLKTISTEAAADVFATDIELNIAGSSFNINFMTGEKVAINLKMPGKHMIHNALIAAALSYYAKVPIELIKQGLEATEAVKGRLQVNQGLSGAKIIDDSYNANPASMLSAIEVLSKYPDERILVVGDMGELGDLAISGHAAVGRQAQKLGIDKLFAVGDLAKHAVDNFNGNSYHFTNKADLLASLIPMLHDKTTVLVKASNSSGLGEVVARLIQKQEV